MEEKLFYKFIWGDWEVSDEVLDRFFFEFIGAPIATIISRQCAQKSEDGELRNMEIIKFYIFHN